MSNIKLILTENKATPYRKQRVVGRLGDGGLTTIDVELLQSDGKTPYAVFSNHELIFVGTNAKGEYTDGVPEILDGQKGIIRYTFTKENFSVLKEFKRAYFQLTDAEGSRVTFQDFTVDVLNNSDIDQGQVTLYVRLLDQLLADFEKRFGNQSVDFEERFKVFLQAKDLQYQNIYQMYNDLVIKLDKLSKDTKSIQEMQAEILKSIEEHDVFTKQESSANVIYQIVSGKKEKIVFSTNFSGKVSGSLVENANSAYIAYSTALNAPTAGTWYEFSDERYSKISDLDDIRDVGSHKVNGQMVLIRIEYDVVDILTSVYSNNFWLSQGISTLDEKVTYIKNNVSEITPHVFGFGSGPSGNRLQLVTWRPDTKVWNDNGATDINSTNQVKDIYAKHSPVVVDQYGKINILLYSYVSDGTIPSGTSIDYSELEIALNISANDYIESKIAANHIENIATEEEAEAGENNEKTMTPLRVFQAIAKWTKDKFVSRTENETVLGVKNFANGLQVGGNNVLTQNGEIRFVTNSTNNSSLESGSIVFKRYGDDVDIYANFQVRASGDLTRDMNIVAESIVDDIFEPGENFSFFVGNETAQAVVKFVGKGIKAHSTLTKGIWYVGTASYKAKNKL